MLSHSCVRRPGKLCEHKHSEGKMNEFRVVTVKALWGIPFLCASSELLNSIEKPLRLKIYMKFRDFFKLKLIF